MILILHCGQTARYKVYLFDCVEDGESQVCFTSLPRRHSSYHVCTICNSLFTVEGTLCVCVHVEVVELARQLIYAPNIGPQNQQWKKYKSTI